MSLPVGFLELADPPWVDGGRAVAQIDRSPAAPIFYRGTVRLLSAGAAPQLGLNRPPRWTIQGGPTTFAQFDAAAAIVSDWAWRESQRGPRIIVDAEPVFIAPNNVFDSRWPRQAFQWRYEYESTAPALYQLQTRDLNTGNPRGNWVRVR